MDQNKLEFLFKTYVDKTADPADREELIQLLEEASEEEVLLLMASAFYSSRHNRKLFSTAGKNRVHQKIQERMDGPLVPQGKPELERKPFYRRLYWPIAAALMIITVTALIFRDNIVDKQSEDFVQLAQAIPPGEHRATLTLADGRTIQLDQQTEGQFVDSLGKVVPTVDHGSLVYEPSAKTPGVELTYHSVTIPRGGQYRVILPDGTKVWLNAGSTLRYPTRFNGNERLVELSGEGYFEVARDETAPFKVRSANQMVQVLGTHFNIDAYPENGSIKTTLLEGKINVHTRKNARTGERQVTILKPGQQSVVTPANTLQVRRVNTSNAIAWKAGLFQFDNTGIREVMQKFSRWYDVDVTFQGTPPAIQLWGRIYRNVDASEALEILKYFDLSYRIIQIPDPDDPGESKTKIVIYSL